MIKKSVLFIDTQFDREKLESELMYLEQISGVCIFIDICDSTKIKQKNVKEWVLEIANTFNLIKSFNNCKTKNFKGISNQITFRIYNVNCN